jgi:hypothetical protein
MIGPCSTPLNSTLSWHPEPAIRESLIILMLVMARSPESVSLAECPPKNHFAEQIGVENWLPGQDSNLQPFG